MGELPKPFIIALSALITDSVIEKGIKSGFDDYSKCIYFEVSIVETPITVEIVQEKILQRLDDIEAQKEGELLEGVQIEEEEDSSNDE